MLNPLIEVGTKVNRDKATATLTSTGAGIVQRPCYLTQDHDGPIRSIHTGRHRMRQARWSHQTSHTRVIHAHVRTASVLHLTCN